ncbi:MAG TPA: DUF177 domain-containing protein [Peptococcaceae bacterium]|nr:DUF177 domain-containing protein [Peptococcaceae bacterium]
MKINVASLRKNEGSSARFEFGEALPPIQIGDGEYSFQSPVKVTLNVTKSGKSLLVKGKVLSELNVHCSRCLKEFTYPLSFDFEDEWLPVEAATQDEEGTALIFDKDEFSIEERIVEHILLHLPMKFLCSEDCRGLCPKCGVDRNLNTCVCSDETIDPRLEILSKWNKGV